MGESNAPEHDLFDEHDRMLDDEHLKAGVGVTFAGAGGGWHFGKFMP